MVVVVVYLAARATKPTSSATSTSATSKPSRSSLMTNVAVRSPPRALYYYFASEAKL